MPETGPPVCVIVVPGSLVAVKEGRSPFEPKAPTPQAVPADVPDGEPAIHAVSSRMVNTASDPTAIPLLWFTVSPFIDSASSRIIEGGFPIGDSLMGRHASPCRHSVSAAGHSRPPLQFAFFLSP